MKGEVFVPIKFNPKYKISNYGNIINSRGKQALQRGKFRYKKTGIKVRGKYKTFLVHRLVAIHFLGNPPTKKHEIRHLDGNGFNNFVGNLAWGTPKENGHDRILHGKTPRGKKCCFTKLTSNAVVKIRTTFKNVNDEKLAKKYGVTCGHIYRIKNKKLCWLYI